MNRSGKIVDDIQALVALLSARCQDRGTLDELARMAADEGLWSQAHDLFDRIRYRTIPAERAGAADLEAQYIFEEICAKTFFNLRRSPAPFDPDSPYWIVPNALELARVLGIPASAVLEIVVPS